MHPYKAHGQWRFSVLHRPKRQLHLHILPYRVLYQVPFHRSKSVTEACIQQRLAYSLPVIVHTSRNIVSQRLTYKLKVLEHHGEDVYVIVIAILANVDAVK